jgi:hypothetical protein
MNCHGTLTNLALQAAAEAVSAATGGSLDYIIANAALQEKTALVGFDTL